MNVPEDRRYTDQHEWVLAIDDGGVRIGITDYAQDALGDVVFVAIVAAGTTVAAGDTIAEIESTKSVAEVYAPIAGEVAAINDALVADPALVNGSPYDDAWFVVITPNDPGAIDALMDAAAYSNLIR
ncbi:MAG TPA: glycine cleavage system protein GcvH [Acidimicrobiia bacterium]|nr:glycine cleavage system protein GcvH [Acidimicrobiia bacterium]